MARQAIVLLLKHNGAVLDLAYLIDEIPKSKYLASNQAMCSLRYLGLVALTVIDKSSVDNANYLSSLRNRYGFSDAHASTRISIK